MPASGEHIVLKAHEFQLLDANGQQQARLGATANGVALTMGSSGSSGSGPQLWLGVDAGGDAALQLFDRDTGAKRVEISLDAKGTHVFLAGEGGQQSYLFLKNGGPTGVVLTDQTGKRRAQVMVDAAGKPDISTDPF